MNLFEYPQLRFIIVKRNEKKPLENDWQNTANYAGNHPVFQSSLKEGFNCGVACGYGGLVVIDIDKKGRDFAEANEMVRTLLPQTLTMKTQSGGFHYYYFCPEIVNEIILKEGMGEIRSRGNQVLCPPSQINGNKYEIEIDVPIVEIKKEQVLTALQKWLTSRDKTEEETIREESQLRIADFIDLKMLTKRGNEYYGAHPLHGSEGGMNFWVNTEKNVFHCFRCNSGGGVLSWIAVKEKLINCEQAQKGALKGKLFADLAATCLEKYNVEIETQRQFFSIEVGNFEINGLKKLFVNTHNHLQFFDLLRDEMGLIGDNYYPIYKLSHYLIMASKEKPIAFKVGKDFYDNRINLLVVGGSGKGKGVLKYAVKRLCDNVVECSGTVHPEQLIGRKVKMGKTIIENKGYLGAKILIHDEAQEVVNETDPQNAQCMNIMRKAQDIYGANQIDKKLTTDIELFEYCPESNFLTFMHPVILLPKFFDTGSFRRYFCIDIGVAEQREFDECIRNMFEDEYKHDEMFKELRKLRFTQDILTFSEEAKKEISEWVLAFNEFVCFNPSQQVRVLGERLFHSLKNYFIRLTAILAISNGEQMVKQDTARKACIDCTQFLIEMLDYYVNYSQVGLSSAIWHTSDAQEAMILEWLYHNGARKEAETKITIADTQEVIGDFCGVNERQARSRFNKMRKVGLIRSKKGRGVSKVWLNFEPKLETIKKPEGFGDDCEKKLESFILGHLGAIEAVEKQNNASEKSTDGKVIAPIAPNPILKRLDGLGAMYPLTPTISPEASLRENKNKLCISTNRIRNNNIIAQTTNIPSGVENSEVKNMGSIMPIAPIATNVDKSNEIPPIALNSAQSPAQQLELMRSACVELSGDFNAIIPLPTLFKLANERGMVTIQANECLNTLLKSGALQHIPEKGVRLVRKEIGGAEND